MAGLLLLCIPFRGKGHHRDGCVTGIRQIEIDVFQDPNGGLFSTAAALKLAGSNGTLSNPAYYQPGWKVRAKSSLILQLQTCCRAL